ncbi:MAG: dTMP kinase [Myxococcota bacterium]
MAHASRGHFIVIEGADGTGTTTQVRSLCQRLVAEGHEVHATAEPSGGEIGKLTRETLRARTMDESAWRSLALLFAADRLEHVAREIEPKLRAGVHVVSDRYTLSSLVYQGLHVPEPWVRELNRFAPPPDHLLVLTLDVDEALRRVAQRRGQAEVYDDEEVQRRVHAGYAKFSSEYGAVAIDAAPGPAQVTDNLWMALQGRGFPRPPV